MMPITKAIQEAATDRSDSMFLSASLKTFDDVVASTKPFAEFSYLMSCTLERYVQRLRMLAKHIPIADNVAKMLLSVSPETQELIIADPIVRSVINEGLARIRFGDSTFSTEEIEGVLQTTLEQFSSVADVGVLQRGVGVRALLRPAQGYGWFWTNDRKDNLPVNCFKKLYQTLEAGKSVLATPTEQEQKIIARAIVLLNAVLPKLRQSALNHVRLVCICDVPEGQDNKKLHFNSFTTIKIPGTTFLARSSINNPWTTAEAILHEALHQKLYDFQHTHSLLQPGADANPASRICAIWNRPSETADNWWPISRALFAFHVYVHLAVLFQAMHQHHKALVALCGPSGDFDPAAWTRRAFDRASYLGHQLAKCASDLGPAGLAILNWLTGLANANDPAPREPGSYVHLLLDLYQRETGEIVSKYQHAESLPADVGNKLKRQLQAEGSMMRQILIALEIPDDFNLPTLKSDPVSLADVKNTRMQISNSLKGILSQNCERSIPFGLDQRTIGQAIQDVVIGNQKYAV
jgi:hypothetical protein